MAVPDKAAQRGLRALRAAALALPGMLPAIAHAGDGASVALRSGHYEEGSRDIGDTRSDYEPIQADTLQYRLETPLDGETRLILNYTQDTWSGATPIASAPIVARGNRATAPDGVSGASPYLYGSMQLDAQLRPVARDVSGQLLEPESRVVHTMSSASPETRKQIDAEVSRDFGSITADASGGISREDDYESVFAGIGATRASTDRLSTVGALLGYTRSSTEAELDHDAAPYIYGFYDAEGKPVYNERNHSSHVERGDHAPRLQGLREDHGVQLGFSRVLSQSAVMEGGLSYTRSSGYLGNPYKAVTVGFIDPAQQWGSGSGNADADYAWDATVAAIPESRPGLRRQGSLDLRVVQHIAPVDAALHLGYRYYRDDWGIGSHTFEAAWVQPLGHGWTITPRLRFYSQSRADFYAPYLLSEQGLYSDVIDPTIGRIYVDSNAPGNGNRYYEDLSGTVAAPVDEDPESWNYGNAISSWNGGVWIDAASGKPVARQSTADALVPATTLFDPSKLPGHYSSDARLSGFGTLGLGVAATRTFGNGLAVEFSWQSIRHEGSLKAGGGAEDSYADFDSSLFSVSLRADLDAAGGAGGTPGWEHHHVDSGHRAPAGLMQSHVPGAPGALMLGYRYEAQHRGGRMLQGSSRTNDAEMIAQACDGTPCYVRPADTGMRMQMLEIMYGISADLSLMLMPQYVDMDMRMRALEGAPSAGGMQDPAGAAVMHSAHTHESGDIGDTALHLQYRMPLAAPGELLLGLGISVPTGKVDLRLRKVMQQDLGYLDYGMQTGSGTWDLLPAISYSAPVGAARWGVQLAAATRLEDRNASGYALGTRWQGDAWIAYPIAQGVYVSLRGTHSREGRIRGVMQDPFTPVGTVDNAANYGGKYWDLGLGLDIDLDGVGAELGNIGIEWQQPVAQDVNGYQLAREGSLLARWERAF